MHARLTARPGSARVVGLRIHTARPQINARTLRPRRRPVAFVVVVHRIRHAAVSPLQPQLLVVRAGMVGQVELLRPTPVGQAGHPHIRPPGRMKIVRRDDVRNQHQHRAGRQRHALGDPPAGRVLVRQTPRRHVHFLVTDIHDLHPLHAVGRRLVARRVVHDLADDHLPGRRRRQCADQRRGRCEGLPETGSHHRSPGMKRNPNVGTPVC